MDKRQFFDQATRCAQAYDQDNQWFGFQRGGPPWSQGTWIQFILAAWKLYEGARTNQLQMVLLGDTKIRSDRGLLFNFGLVANSTTPQEAKDAGMVEELMRQRGHVAAGGRAGDAIAIIGPGSILSAERWSPLLNDALMLGAIKAGQDFHFALNEDEQITWRQLRERSPGRAAFAARRAVFAGAGAVAPGPEAQAKEAWLEFLHAVPRVLWEGGRPRVFVRELMGFKIFGYEPVFTMHELGFRPGGNAQAVPNFSDYLAGLRAVGFENADRQAIMRALSEFLFGNHDALASIGA